MFESGLDGTHAEGAPALASAGAEATSALASTADGEPAPSPDTRLGATLPARAWVDRHPVAARLEAMAPGAALVRVLEDLEAADLDRAALVEGVAAWERVAGWVVARQAVLIAELSRRARGSEIDLVPDEVAARLTTTRRAAERTCDLALGLDEAPAVAAALESGVIDARKARVIVEATEHLPSSVAGAVRAAALVRAPGLTAPGLGAVIRRLEITADPAAAEQRHVQARDERCVRLDPAPDAMAWIHALLPAPDAVTVMSAVDALAASCAPEDNRGIDARRADALVDVLRQVLDSGIGPQGPLPTTQRRRPHLHVTVNPAALLASSTTHPPRAHPPGSTPSTTHPPGSTPPTTHPPGSTPLTTHPPGSTPLTTHPPGSTPSSARMSDAAAYLAGYGPIPAAVVHEVAQQATWRAVGIDPRTGELAARSAKTYRPTTALAGLVVDRDVTCTFPGCRIPATRCDIDHIEPFIPSRPAEHQTTVENLHTLCRHHHRLKTTGHWTPVRDPATGVTTWTSPTGHTYTRDPIPLDPTYDDPPRRHSRPTTHADDDRRPAAPDWQPTPDSPPTPDCATTTDYAATTSADDARSDADADADDDSDAGARPEHRTHPTTEEPPAADAQRDADTRPGASRDADTRPEASRDADIRPEASPETDTRPGASRDADTRPEPSPETDTRPEASPETDTRPEASPEADTRPEASRDADATTASSRETPRSADPGTAPSAGPPAPTDGVGDPPDEERCGTPPF